MYESELLSSEDNPDIRAFHDALNTVAGKLFAVVDGAHFDDLEDELADLGIPSRSLFLRGGSEAMRRDGPWLVDIQDEGTRMHIVELALTKHCVVFWLCAGGGNVLWKHLRTINEVLVPDDRIEGNIGAEGALIKYERVLFRHWNSNVLGDIIPTLNKPQRARLCGPAQMVFFNGLRPGSLKQLRDREIGDDTLRGPLRFEPGQIGKISQTIADRSRRRIFAFMREHPTPQISTLDDEQLMKKIKFYEAQASEFGIDQHRARLRFSWLMIAGNDRFTEQPGVRHYLRNGPGNPNYRMDLLAEAMAEAALRKGER